MNTAAISGGTLRRALILLAAALLLGAARLAAQDENGGLDDLMGPSAAPSAPAPIPPQAPAAGGGGLDDLQDSGSGLEGLEAASPAAPTAPASAQPSQAATTDDQPKALSLTFNGYVKPLAVWESRAEVGGEFKSAGAEELNRFTTLGARTQVRAQGVIKNTAQFFTAVNFDFNEVDRDTDRTSARSEKGELRMVESYIDLFGGGTRWRVGSQLVTWGFMDGFEVPADRFNARDTGYKSVELEDLKLAETGVEFSWSAGKQRLDLFYVPVSKVNRLPPDFERAFIQEPVVQDDGSELQPVAGTGVTSNNGKYAAHAAGTAGSMDYQLNYVDTVDPRADLAVVAYAEGTGGAPYAKRYHRTRSPGLDLQFDLGAALARFSTVYFNTEDSNNDDPFIQNDWYQVMAGAEFWAGSALMQLNIGRKEVVDWGEGDPENLSGAAEDQVFIRNAFLGQPAKSTNIVAGSFNDTYLTGAALEFNLLLAYLWDAENGDLIAFRVRPFFAYNLADGVAVTFMPSYGNEIGNETYEVYTELKFSF